MTLLILLEGGSGLAWEIYYKPLAKRHKAAFVILNTYLKHHLFSVEFDASLTNLLSTDLINDLQELVFVAKPSYTYIVLTPFTFYEEILTASETFDLEPTLQLGGDAGEIIAANENPLLVIGSSWRIGSWFKYTEGTESVNTPLATISTPLPTEADHDSILSKPVPPADFTSNSLPIQFTDNVWVTSATGFSADISDAGSDDVEIVLDAAVLDPGHLMSVISITGSGAGNDGDYTIGQVVSDTACIAVGPFTAPESGLTWTLKSSGSFNGTTYITDTGASHFIDQSEIHEFSSGHVGDYVRRKFISSENSQSYRINSIVSDTEVDLAQVRRVEPIASDPNFTVDTLASSTFTVDNGDVLFSSEMCKSDRETSVQDSKRFFVVFPVGGGPPGDNGGTRARILQFVNTSTVILDTVLVAETGAEYYIEVEEAYSPAEETSDWEHIRDQIVIDGTTIDLSNTPTQDAGVNRVFTSYGVIEPQDPTVQVFDASDGDTLYSIGMPDPHQFRLRSRTGRDTDLREDPIEITRT